MVRIVTDSVCDLPKDLARELGIEVMPLTVSFDGEIFKDGVDINTEEVFKRLEKTGEFPKTSQVSPGEFIEKFEELTSEKDEVICITMSSKLSGTYNSAILAKSQLEGKNIEVIDSKGITLGYGLLVVEAARMAKEGEALETIARVIREKVEKMEYLIVFDTLEYVYKGGRISKAQYIMANFLNIKVIMTVKNGELEVLDKVRGRKRAVKYIADYMEKQNIDFSQKTIGINHANDLEYMGELRDKILEKNSPKEIIYSTVGSTVAAYSGLSAVALYFEREV